MREWSSCPVPRAACFSQAAATGFCAALSEEDPIVQLEVDDTKNSLYTRSEKGAIQVFDLGTDGQGLTKVAAANHQSITKEATRIAQ